MRKFLPVLLILVVATIASLFFLPKDKPILSIDNSPTVIGIQPFGSVPDREIDSVKVAMEEMYGFEVKVLDKVDLPDMAYTTIRYPRYRADSLVKWLAHSKPDSVDIIVGLTNKDISITKYKPGTKEIKDPEWMYKDFGIFGLGQVGGAACVVSSNRLHKDVSTKKFFVRLTRITCHEVGHVLGLKHCPEPNCLMNDANESIRTIDNSTGVLCADCKASID